MRMGKPNHDWMEITLTYHYHQESYGFLTYNERF